MSAARQIIVLEDPAAWAGIEPGSNKVLLVSYCDGYEIRIRWDALAAIVAAQHLEHFGNRLLVGHGEIVDRQELEFKADDNVVDRDRPAKLDA